MKFSIDEQCRRAGQLMSAHGLHTLVISKTANLGWLLGCRSQVALTGGACFLAVLSGATESPEVEIWTTSNEVDRLREVEFAKLTYRGTINFRVLDWWQPLWTELPAGEGVGADAAIGPQPADRRLVGAGIARLRLVLTPQQQVRLARLTWQVGRLVESVAEAIRPGQTEADIAGRTAEALVGEGIEPIVLLVGSGEALATHRHPLPTPRPVRERCMVSVGARRGGQFTSVTRYVSLGSPQPESADAFIRLLEVEAALLDASVPGRRLSEALAAGRAAYLANGFGEDAWRRHHQGGLGGFAAREVIAGRDDVVLQEGMVAAWNPSAAGWKTEDVAVTTVDGCRVATPETIRWPILTVHGRPRPGYLVV